MKNTEVDLKVKAPLALPEFVSLMALLMSLGALAIDAMLPALPQMGVDFQVITANDTQLIISSVFLGFGIGQLFYGPLSDSFGRKKMIYFGMVLFLLGCFISIFAQTYPLLLIGRVIQGLGVASTRVITLAMVRDQHRGDEMAKIMSLITMVFIIVPALAPSLGQLVLVFAEWRAIFWTFILLAGVGTFWLAFRQEETLPIDMRKPFSLKQLLKSSRLVLASRVSMGYTVASGLFFGAFISYIITAQQIFQEVFKVGDQFPIYFGVLAVAIGLSSYINSKLVVKFGMKKLTWVALAFLTIISTCFFAYIYGDHGIPSLSSFMIYMLGAFGCIGVLFGNFNTLAIEPLGEIAGTASSLISFMQNVISLVIATLIGMSFDGTVYPLVAGFAVLGFCSIVVMSVTEKVK